MYMYVQTYTFVHVNVRSYVHTFVYVSYVRRYAGPAGRIYVHRYVCIYVCMYVCMFYLYANQFYLYVCVYVCMSACVRACRSIYMPLVSLHVSCLSLS